MPKEHLTMAQLSSGLEFELTPSADGRLAEVDALLADM